MTPQDQDLQRIRAWDRYQNARRSFLASKALVQQWEKSLKAVVERLKFHLYEVAESDCDAIPTHDSFREAVATLRAAKLELERAREEAVRWGFPVDPEDLKYSPLT